MTSRILLLIAFLVLGFFEAFVLKLRNTASVTWIIGLLALAFWIAYPLSAARFLVGSIVFVVGLALVITYYRNADRDEQS